MVWPTGLQHYAVWCMVTNVSEAPAAHCHKSEQNLNEVDFNIDDGGSILLQNIDNQITMS